MAHHSLRFLLAALLIVASVFSGGSASAADTTVAQDKSTFSVLDPTPDSALRTFAPDRPARAISPITVDAGRWQIESDFLSYSLSSQQGTATRTFQAADPVLKLGLTNLLDIEVAFGGFIDMRTTDHVTGLTTSQGRGAGDVPIDPTRPDDFEPATGQPRT